MLKKPRGLSAAMTAGMVPGEQREDGLCAGLRVRWQAFVKRVFFEQYRTRALWDIRLGEVGPQTLAKARDAAFKDAGGARGRERAPARKTQRSQSRSDRVTQRQTVYDVEDMVEKYIGGINQTKARSRERAP